ncbi:PAS domain-containing protein [Thermodesulfobacteriota bacterium]
MPDKLSYEELEYKVKVLEREAAWRQQAENALRESEERFRGLFENAPVWIHLLDTHGTILLANPISVRESGYDEIELLDCHFTKFFTPASQKTFHEHFALLAEKGIHRQDVEIIRKDRGILTMHCTISAIHDEQQNIKFFVAFLRDITGRQTAE